MNKELNFTLGAKIYEPKNSETEDEINKLLNDFREGLGPNSAKFVLLSILEGEPEGMRERINIYREIIDKDPFALIIHTDQKAEFINKRILGEKGQGAAHGLSEHNNPKLTELGVAGVFVGEVGWELVRKYPQRYLEHRKIAPKK